jgi:hypothetical protein
MKMLNITNQQRNENQNHSEVITLLLLDWLLSEKQKLFTSIVKRQKITSTGKITQKRDNWWGYKLVQPLWKSI